MSRRHNGGARKIARHLWFWPVRGSRFSDDVTLAQSVLNLLHLPNQVLVITIHITGLMRHTAFTLWMCRSRRDCRQCILPGKEKACKEGQGRRWRASSR